MQTVKVKDIVIGNTYLLKGEIMNGIKDGKPYTSPEEVTRKVTNVTDTHVICECGRRFLKNKKLTIKEF